MSAPLASYLKDFSATRPAATPLATDFDDFDAGFPALIEADPVDLEEERRKAFADGHDAATAELTASFEQERAELLAGHRRELDALRQQLSADAAVAIGRGLNQIAAGISARVAEDVVTGIAPFFSQEVQNAAIAELAQRLEAAILSGDTGKITVKGPPEMFELLQQAMATHGEALIYVPADDLDLSVELADTVLVTRVSAWAASLKKVLG